MSISRAAAPTLARLGRARAQQESTVRWLNLLSPVLVVAVPVVAWRGTPEPGLTGQRLALTLALAGFVAGVLGRNATVARRDSAVHIGFVAVLFASSVTMMSVQPGGPGPECVLLAVLCVAVALPGRAGVAVVVAGFALVAAITGFTDRDFGTLAVLAVFAALYGMLLLAFRLAQANRQAERLLAELERTQAAQAEAAGLAERQRLAREMHDVLAHSLSGLMLQLEGARMLSADSSTDPQLREAVGRAHRLGKSGLDEARRAIGMLRDDALPGPERLAWLAEQFEQDRGVPCTVTVSGEAHDLTSQARIAIYRVAQEALTNVIKHSSGPTRVELRLTYEPSRTLLVVEDFADSVAHAPLRGNTVSGGYGLTGMRERAELLGGTLITEATGSGFRVELRLPNEDSCQGTR